jgi:endoglucanase
MLARLLGLTLGVISLSGCGGGTAVIVTPTPTPTTSVTVSGINLMRNGVLWIPHGAQIIAFVAPPAVQSGPFAQAYAHYSTAELSAIKTWGADTVRFQVSQPGADPQNTLYTASFVAQVQAAVNFARSIGLNVIVCVQDETQSGETNPATVPNGATVRVWQGLAPLFNSDTGILYEIMNEPRLMPNTANWTTWQTATNTAMLTDSTLPKCSTARPR